MIQAENISKQYGNRTAICNLSFYTDYAEVLGIFGVSGAGKTTLTRLLSACTFPSTGRVTVCGFDTTDHSLEVRKRIGYLSQKSAIYTDMTVESFLLYVAQLHQVEGYTHRVQEVISEFGLTDQAKILIAKLSPFQQQQVRLAQIVLHQPNVLILDEPTVGLAPNDIIKLHNLMRALIGQYTIVLATRVWSEIEQFCDRVLLLNDGCVADEQVLVTSTKQRIY